MGSSSGDYPFPRSGVFYDISEERNHSHCKNLEALEIFLEPGLHGSGDGEFDTPWDNADRRLQEMCMWLTL